MADFVLFWAAHFVHQLLCWLFLDLTPGDVLPPLLQIAKQLPLVVLELMPLENQKTVDWLLLRILLWVLGFTDLDPDITDHTIYILNSFIL